MGGGGGARRLGMLTVLLLLLHRVQPLCEVLLAADLEENVGRREKSAIARMLCARSALLVASPRVY